MGRAKRRQLLIALGIVMLIGIAVYLRLWTIDYRISSNDTELLRRQFDFASREAMDESAEWRRRYDGEFDKASKCFSELEEECASSSRIQGARRVPPVSSFKELDRKNMVAMSLEGISVLRLISNSFLESFLS
ncbi:hypothetical protein OROMI_012137 [Orobanche minor]